MRQIDERLFRWLYGSFPKIGTFYYAARQPILIVLLGCLDILLAAPCGIVVGIMHCGVTTVSELSEAVRATAFRLRRYTATLKALWQGATITIKEGGNK